MNDGTEPTPAAQATGNERFNYGLIADIIEVLEKHGYKLPGVEGSPDRHRALGQTTTALLDLVETYEGKRL